MTGNPVELCRKFFGAVRAVFWLWGSFLAPDEKKLLKQRGLPKRKSFCVTP